MIDEKEQHMNRRGVAAVAAVAGSLVIAACGGDDDDVAQNMSAPAATTPVTAAASTTELASFNDADVEFAQGMIAHHQQAIEMAELALDPNAGASPEVLDLAGRIQAAQDPEITLMTGWLNAWGQPVAMDMSDGHDMASMEGMMSAEDMDALAASTGPAFDTMWLEMMIAHHEGAIAQSQAVTTDGYNPEVLSLADKIIDAQTAEIEEMQGLLAG